MHGGLGSTQSPETWDSTSNGVCSLCMASVGVSVFLWSQNQHGTLALALLMAVYYDLSDRGVHPWGLGSPTHARTRWLWLCHPCTNCQSCMLFSFTFPCSLFIWLSQTPCSLLVFCLSLDLICRDIKVHTHKEKNITLHYVIMNLIRLCICSFTKLYTTIHYRPKNKWEVAGVSEYTDLTLRWCWVRRI